ncbi:GmrSD restriction endonuclease domain-containing protein [Herbiconiux liukaitaii]|uniref:GmrSD restriction endonuclease domain-containing protein n=1 Tax=Herbiconiux liukaitaii TaxID=3342799 RepID=UPI0035B6ECE5
MAAVLAGVLAVGAAGTLVIGGGDDGHLGSRAGLSAAAVLETLPVKGRAPKTGYEREGRFGEAWIDVDRNGCDTRNDILVRDLVDLTMAGSCRVLSGTLSDPYTGATIAFVRGEATSPAVQIDHVVALLDAWQSGAQQLTQEERVAFANDPLNLYAVDGPANSQKGAGNAATWLPSNKAFRCEYAARQVSVKAAYGLWVTAPEKDALDRILDTCPSEPALDSPLQAATPDTDGTAPTPTYANCDAVRQAGAAPLRAGDPGFGPHLDRDANGIACG